MLLTLERIWAKVQEFMGRIDKLETESRKAKTGIEHVENKVELLDKGLRHQDKILDHQGQLIVDLQHRTKKLESEKKGLAISAGKAKAKNKKLQLQAELRKDH